VIVEARGLGHLVVALGEARCVASGVGIETGRELEMPFFSWR
jgi:hypothetical protein